MTPITKQPRKHHRASDTECELQLIKDELDFIRSIQRQKDGD